MVKKTKQGKNRETSCNPLGAIKAYEIKPCGCNISRMELSAHYMKMVNPNVSEFELSIMDLMEMRKIIACAIWSKVKLLKGQTKWLERIADFVQLSVRTIRCLLKKPKKM